MARRTAPRRAALLALCFLLVALVSLPRAAVAQGAAMKAVSGKVLGNSGPLQSAIVYLQDSKSNNIRSFISTADGSYRFGQLSPDVDYTIWAEFKGTKSDTKAISAFNSKKNFIIDLHIKLQ